MKVHQDSLNKVNNLIDKLVNSSNTINEKMRIISDMEQCNLELKRAQEELLNVNTLFEHLVLPKLIDFNESIMLVKESLVISADLINSVDKLISDYKKNWFM